MRAAIFKGRRERLGLVSGPIPSFREPTDRGRAGGAGLRVRVGPLVLPGRVGALRAGSIGHEFIGVVEQVGAEVDSVRRG